MALRTRADQRKNRADMCAVVDHQARRAAASLNLSGRSRKWSTGTKNCLPGSARVERSTTRACVRIRACAVHTSDSDPLDRRNLRPAAAAAATTTARTPHRRDGGEASRYFLLCPYMRPVTGPLFILAIAVGVKIAVRTFAPFSAGDRPPRGTQLRLDNSLCCRVQPRPIMSLDIR